MAVQHRASDIPDDGNPSDEGDILWLLQRPVCIEELPGSILNDGAAKNGFTETDARFILDLKDTSLPRTHIGRRGFCGARTVSVEVWRASALPMRRFGRGDTPPGGMLR